jgi:hypothetical protein
VYINNTAIDIISLYLTDATSDDTIKGLVLNWSITLIIEEYELPITVDISKFKETNLDTMNKRVISELEDQKTDDINYLLEQKTKLENDINTFRKSIGKNR